MALNYFPREPRPATPVQPIHIHIEAPGTVRVEQSQGGVTIAVQPAAGSYSAGGS